jgi:hypothetical protein
MDPARSRALLIGVSSYRGAGDLEDLPAVRAGVRELERLLLDPEHGGLQPSACRVLIDPASPDEVDRELARCARDAEDTFLVYYSGHGVPDQYDGALHLAVTTTERDRLHATAIPFEWVRRALRASPAGARVVILDCCFSGRAIQPMSAGELAAEADIAGSFVMTASAANRTALAPEGEPFTAFTGALLEILRDGIADAGELLDLESIFRRARAALASLGRPEPQAQRINAASQLALSKNPASGAQLELVAVRERALSRDPADRHSIVAVLARIARRDSRHARAAQRLLDNLLHDPVPEVAEVARASQAPRAAWPPIPRASDLPTTPRWYRFAVFYELDVEAFCDGDYDGHGDLIGLLEKLDYLQWLGVNCIVLSPISPPDDPTAITISYGDPGDAMALIDGAHAQGIRVVCSLQTAPGSPSTDELERAATAWLDRGFDGIRLSKSTASAVDVNALADRLARVCSERDRVLILSTARPVSPDSPLARCNCLIARADFGPKVLMAVRREDAAPLTDALRCAGRPDCVPEGLYVRDGRELPLDVLPAEEAEYMVAEYARDPRARLGSGIRRRLAPLLDNDRPTLELVYALLFTLPGSPFLYYGDEIGMGENLDLDDRNALCTPFQWIDQPLGGFSGGIGADLVRPLGSDTVYGVHAVNVESQLRTPASLLRWLRRLIAVRHAHPVFAVGALGLIETSNPRVLAFTRTFEDDAVLVTANLSRSPNAVELQLTQWRNRIPVEMFGRVPFPRIGDLPYLLTFPGRSLFMLALEPQLSNPDPSEP